MLGRFRGFFRDSWWLLVLMVFGGIFLSVMVVPVLGICAFAAGLGVWIYFAIMRYDNEGNSRPQGPSH